MRPDSITRAWLQLLFLSIVSVFLVSGPALLPGPVVTGALVLVAAWLKARVVLSQYLGLCQAPRWQSGFNWFLGAHCLLLLALYIAPQVIR